MIVGKEGGARLGDIEQRMGVCGGGGRWQKGVGPCNRRDRAERFWKVDRPLGCLRRPLSCPLCS